MGSAMTVWLYFVLFTNNVFYKQAKHFREDKRRTSKHLESSPKTCLFKCTFFIYFHCMKRSLEMFRANEMTWVMNLISNSIVNVGVWEYILDYNLVLCDPGLSSCSSGGSSSTEASAIINESVERLLILSGARRLRSVGVKGSRPWALWDGATFVLVPVWVCHGGFLIGEEVSISCMNAGLSIPAEEIKGQHDAKILVPSVRICNEFQCNKKYMHSIYVQHIMFSIQSVCLPPDLFVILPGKLAAASLLEALSAENSKSDQKKTKNYLNPTLRISKLIISHAHIKLPSSPNGWALWGSTGFPFVWKHIRIIHKFM